MKKNINYLPNLLEEYVIEKDQRERIEKEILEELTETEIKVITKRCGFEGEVMSYSECACALHCSGASIRKLEAIALEKIRLILSQTKNKIIDSETMMTLRQLNIISEKITNYLEIFIYLNDYNFRTPEQVKLLRNWCCDFILRSLSKEEKQFLLDYFIFYMIDNRKYQIVTLEEQNQLGQLQNKFIQRLEMELSFCKKVKVK